MSWKVVRKKTWHSHSISCAFLTISVETKSDFFYFLFFLTFKLKTKFRKKINKNFKSPKMVAWLGITVKRPVPESDQWYDWKSSGIGFLAMQKMGGYYCQFGNWKTGEKWWAEEAHEGPPMPESDSFHRRGSKYPNSEGIFSSIRQTLSNDNQRETLGRIKENTHTWDKNNITPPTPTHHRRHLEN